MAWCRTDCKVGLNWSVALSYAHVLCARLIITWTTLITHPTLHFCTLYRQTKVSTVLYKHSFIFSTTVNSKRSKNLSISTPQSLVKTVVGRPYLTCALHWPYTAYCNTIAQRIRIFPNWQKPGQTEAEGEVSNHYQQPKRTTQTIMRGRGELKLPRW